MMLPHVSTTRLAYTVPYEWCNRGMPLTQRLATHLQGVAVCCSVLQCVAIHIMSHVTYEWCNRGMPLTQGLATHVQCAAVCCSVLQCVLSVSIHIMSHLTYEWYNGMSHVTYESVMSHMNDAIEWCLSHKASQPICSVLQRVAVCCSVLQCIAVCCSVLQYI